MWAWLHLRRLRAVHGVAAAAAHVEAEQQLVQARAQGRQVDAVERAGRAALRRRDDFTAAIEQALRRRST
jgi:hypothetical protein